MTDYTELKRLAEACGDLNWRAIQENWCEWTIRDDHGYIATMRTKSAKHTGPCPDRESKAKFLCAVTPAAVLALIAESERIQEAHEQICTNYNQVSYASEERGKQIDQLKAELEHTGYDHDLLRNERDQLKAENEALRREREGKVLCDLELFETLRDAANTEADEHRQCMATYRPLRQANLDSVVKKCDGLLAAMGKGEQS